MFSFDSAFELHNDIDVLKKMGLDCGLHSGSCSAENLRRAKSMLPRAFGEMLDGKQHCTVAEAYEKLVNLYYCCLVTCAINRLF